jgi:hypothetical protein
VHLLEPSIGKCTCQLLAEPLEQRSL